MNTPPNGESRVVTAPSKAKKAGIASAIAAVAVALAELVKWLW